MKIRRWGFILLRTLMVIGWRLSLKEDSEYYRKIYMKKYV